jgi:hypothetical protein
MGKSQAMIARGSGSDCATLLAGHRKNGDQMFNLFRAARKQKPKELRQENAAKDKTADTNQQKLKDSSQQSAAPYLDRYVTTAPSAQNALDILQGEWISCFPAPHASLQAGKMGLFQDYRICWGVEQLGGVEGKKVLELGPLEAGHSYMLEQMGAAEVVAVEANTRAYLKCLIVKEVMGLKRTRFLCGDFMEYLRDDPPRFDVALASGVLYHMRKPVHLLGLLAGKCDRLFMWTHYYDPSVLQRPHLAPKFTGSLASEQSGFRHTLYRYEYQMGTDHKRFCGGTAEFSHWLSRSDILSCLEHFGFGDVHINFEEPDHPHGPAFVVTAVRK